MKNLIFLIALAYAFTFFISCKKEVEATTADITIWEPLENDTLLNAAELHMAGTITGNGDLHGYTLSVINAATDSVVYTVGSSTHTNSYSFHEHWVNNVTDTTLMKVMIDVTLNHEGTKTSKTVNVVCLP
jgi:hypothetical protein